MMQKPIGYFDLDQTLYDTPRLIADIFACLRELGHDDNKIQRTRDRAVAGGYTFEQHLRFLGHSEHAIQEHVQILNDLLRRGDYYLLPGVPEGLRILAEKMPCALLTFGDPSFQRRKFLAVRAFNEVFIRQWYVWQRHTKGDVIRDHGHRRTVWALDDMPEQLQDIRQKAPWARCVRMRAAGIPSHPHPEDGIAWEVVTSFQEFVTLVA